MTLKTLTSILLATSILLFTACDSKTTTETAQTQNPIAQPIEETSTEGGDDITTGGTTQNGGSTAGGATSDSRSDDNTTASGRSVNDDNTTTTPTVTLSSLTLTINKTTLNKDENTTVNVEATYSDNSTKEVTDKVEWIVVPRDAVKVANATLTALKDKATTVKVKLANKTSDAISLNITWVVNGHVLPPEPDKTLNDSTLLGIDTNDNGVRDDVERWIYTNYEDKHPIHVDIAMQAGKAWQKVLEDPSKAKEIYPIIDAASSCEAYFRVCVNDGEKNKYSLERISSSDIFIRAIFNIRDRWDAYIQYDSLLSGATYVIPRCSKKKDLCNFDISKYEE